MASSQTDEFFDDWGDLSPGFTDRVLQNVALVEKQTEHANNKATRNPYPNEKTTSTFRVFRDPPEDHFESPQNQNLTPLREIDLNQYAAKVGSKFSKKDTPSKDTKQVDTTKRRSCTKMSVSTTKAVNHLESDDDEHMWMDFDVDFQSMITDLEKDGALDGEQAPPLNTVRDDPARDDPVRDDPVKGDPVDKEQVESTLTKFGGFVNAYTEKSMESNSKAREIALSLFNNRDESLFKNPKNDKSTHKEPLVNYPATTTLSKSDSTPSEPSPPKIMGGFTTGRGNPVARSSESSLRRAQDLLFAPDLNTTREDSLPQCGQKRPVEDADETQFKYEDVLSEFGGFKTGKTETTITVSSEAKRRAVSLFNFSETTRELTQASQSTQQSPNSSFSSQQSLLRTLSLEADPKQPPPPPPSPNQQAPKRIRKSAHGKTKPYRSPVIKDKYELTKAAISGQPVPGTVRGKGPCVFSMKANAPRYPLSKLGKPLQHSLEELKHMNISDEILHLTVANAANVRFSGFGPQDIREALLKAGALEKFIPKEWVENHYRWVVWKIACMIRSYPTKFQDWWCKDKVVEQLLYRYEREINLGHRSVLKRIHEHDDTPVKHMVLVIAAITKLESTPQDGKAIVRKYQLLLSDGWYGIPAVADPRMERAITNGKLSVGTKLSICGAQLVGDMQPHSPLDASSSNTLLSITTNGSRIAAWDTKLGYHPQRLVYRSLSTVHEDGGVVTALDVIVCRKYPMIYTELLSDGTRVKRTAREEEEIQRGMRLYQDGMSEGWRPPFLEHGGVQISHFDKEPPTDRKVSAFFKVRICDYHHGNKVATLLLLDANELYHMDICEGNRYRIFFTMPYTLEDKSNTINLKTTRRTRWETMRMVDPAKLESTCYIPRHITTTAAVSTLESGFEVDVAVLVLHSTYTEEKRPSEGRSFWHQTLIVTDTSKGLCQIKLKLACRPMRNIDGQVIGFANLRYQVHDAKYSITHLKAGDDCEIYLKQKAAPYMIQAIQSVHQWIQNNSNEVQEVKQRVKDLLR